MKKIILLVLSIILYAGMVRAESSAETVAQDEQPTNIGVPSECEDVMLQAFYWDSYKNQTSTDSKYGRTKWVDLLKDTAAINANFDLVWFPPSAYADGGNGKGGVGYTHRQLSNQESDWGTRAKLEELIAALHKGNTRVLADIVINHRGNKSNWCDFYADNFGTFGTYQLTSAHICKNDEVNSSSSAGSCKGAATGANDTGTNFDGARDLDHSNEYVQGWAKAYLKWMLKAEDIMQDLFSGIKNADDIVAGKKAPSTLGVKAVGKYKLVVNLEKQLPYFKLLMGFVVFAPQNQRAVEQYGSKYGTAAKYMCYDGPFKMTEWTGTNLKWKLVRNDNYWDKKNVKLSEINFSVSYA